MKTRISPLTTALIFIAALPTTQAATYDVGNTWVGMTANGNATLTGTTSSYRADISGDVTVKALGFINAKAAEGQVTATLFNDTKGTTTGYLTVAGLNVARFDETFVSARTVRTPSVVAGLSCPRLRFGIGPLTLGVKFYGNASAWAEATAAFTLNPNPALPPVAKLTAGPNAEAVVGGEVDLSLVIVRGGVNGQCRVAKHALNGVLMADFAQSKGTADVIWSRWDPEGSVVGFVQIKLFFFKKTWSRTLLSWGGGQTDVNLVSQTFNLGYKKPTLPTPTPAPGIVPVL